MGTIPQWAWLVLAVAAYVALTGNPNCGKTTLFNALTGLRAKVGNYAGVTGLRLGLFALGAVFLFGYGTFLNLAPLRFGQVAGLYIATLFIVWQFINFIFFRTLPTLPILAGGALIVMGGVIVSFWKQ